MREGSVTTDFSTERVRVEAELRSRAEYDRIAIALAQAADALWPVEEEAEPVEETLPEEEAPAEALAKPKRRRAPMGPPKPGSLSARIVEAYSRHGDDPDAIAAEVGGHVRHTAAMMGKLRRGGHLPEVAP